MKNQRFLFTGGPGVGKTSTLEALQARGCVCVSEVARGIIRDRLSLGLSPRPEPPAFAKQIFEADIAQYDRAPGDQPVFFDRGLPDSLGMMSETDQIQLIEAIDFVKTHPYNPTVFFFPPWEEIFTQDAERDQTFADALNIAETIRSWYKKLGFELLPVPFASVQERADWVLRIAEG